MGTTFDRYLLRRFFHVFAILAISAYGLFVVIDGFTNIDGFQSGSQGTWGLISRMVVYYGYQATIFFDLIAGALSTISAVVVMAMLFRNSELHPLLAAGVPLYRLVVPLLIGSLSISGLLAVNREIVIPRVAHQLQMPRSAQKANLRPVQAVYDLESFIRISGNRLSLVEQKVLQAEFLLPAPHITAELTPLHAAESVFHPGRGDRPSGWILHNVEPRFDLLNLTPTGQQYVRSLKDRPEDVFIVTDVSCDELADRSASVKFASTSELINRSGKGTGEAVANSVALRVHNRLIEPLYNIVAVCLALPLVLRRESRGLVANMALCACTLTVLTAMNQGFNYLGGANIVNPDLAAWLPLIVDGSIAAWISTAAQT